MSSLPFLPAHRRWPALAVAAALPLAAATPASRAQAVADADPVVITATRTPQRVSAQLAEVTVIDRAQIERAGALTLAQLLARQGGVQSWSTGGRGANASMSIRGLESRHTLLLVDGVRYGSATLGIPTPENLPLAAIERIEIVRGPLSALYGSDAVGGVVQVFTRGGADGARAEGWRPYAGIAAGSLGLVQAEAGAALRAGGGSGGAAGALDLAFGVQAERSRGVSATREDAPFGVFDPDRDGFRQRSAHAQAGLSLPGGWRAQARVLASRGEVQFDDGPGADARARLVSDTLSLEVGGPVTAGWRTRLTAGRSTDGNDTLASASPYTTPGNTGTVQRQLAWEHTVATPAGTLLLLAETLRQTVTRPGGPEEAYEVSERRTDALALGLTGAAGPHTWQGAWRRDRNAQFGRPSTGSLGYGYAITPQWRVSASAGTSFVAPSFNQLYYPGFGNPLLLPERGRHAELALRWSDGGHALQATAFDHRIRGYITAGPQPVNLPRTRVEGLSLSYDGQWAGWNVGASADRIDARNASAGSDDEGRWLPRRARHQARLALDREWPAAGWRTGAEVLAVGRRYDDAANTLPLAAYRLLALHAEWTLPAARDWRLALRVDNATGERHETALGYPQPGRQWRLALRWGGR